MHAAFPDFIMTTYMQSEFAAWFNLQTCACFA